MVFYWGLFILVLILSLCASFTKKYSNIFLIVFLLCIFIFFAFREGFTPDYCSYELAFDEQRVAERNENEIGFSWIISFFTYRQALFLQTFLICACLYIAFSKYIPTKYWWYAVVIMFFVKSFLLGNIGAFRSCFVSICFFLALLCKQKFKYGTIMGILLLILSSTVHTSGLMMLPFLLLSVQKFNNKTYKLLLFISLILLFFSLFFASTLNDIVNNIIVEKFDKYETYMEEGVSDTITIGIFTILRLIMLSYLFFKTLRYTTKDSDSNYSIYIKLTAIYFMLDILPGIGLISRFKYYLIFPFLIGVIYIVNKERVHKNGWLYLSMLALYVIWDLYLFLNSPLIESYYNIYHNEFLGI